MRHAACGDGSRMTHIRCFALDPRIPSPGTVECHPGSGRAAALGQASGPVPAPAEMESFARSRSSGVTDERLHRYSVPCQTTLVRSTNVEATIEEG